MPSAVFKSVVQFHFLRENFSLRDRRSLKLFLEGLFRKEKKKLASLSYIFCSDPYLLEVNRQFLRHDFYTDIISFDLSDKGEPTNGEIYISIDRVKENARSFDTSFKRELHRVIFHGALHLCGYKDKKKEDQQKMRKMEDKYLDLYL